MILGHWWYIRFFVGRKYDILLCLARG